MNSCPMEPPLSRSGPQTRGHQPHCRAFPHSNCKPTSIGFKRTKKEEKSVFKRTKKRRRVSNFLYIARNPTPSLYVQSHVPLPSPGMGAHPQSFSLFFPINPSQFSRTSPLRKLKIPRKPI